jgi:hypothetical protein
MRCWGTVMRKAGTVGSVTLGPVAYVRERGATGSQARLELHAKSC